MEAGRSGQTQTSGVHDQTGGREVPRGCAGQVWPGELVDKSNGQPGLALGVCSE